MSKPERSAKPTSEQALSRFATRAQRAIGLRGDVNICITSDRGMRALNRRFRRKNVATDVLSFPSESPGVAGDIAISLEIAARNSFALGHSLADEVKILIVHGLLHLAGHDHEADNGEMLTWESGLRRKFKLPVGLIERASTPRGRVAPSRGQRSAPRVKRASRKGISA
jgi:probable rRNA maturation factor